MKSLRCLLGFHGTLEVTNIASAASPAEVVRVRCTRCRWEGEAHGLLSDPTSAILRAISDWQERHWSSPGRNILRMLDS